MAQSEHVITSNLLGMLKKLDLSNNNITGKIPSEIGLIEGTEPKFSGNKFTPRATLIITQIDADLKSF